MGRQHTTWISDETWDRLQNIPGDSVSKKISNAVKFADPEEQMRQNALMRQFATAKGTLRMIASQLPEQPHDSKQVAIENIYQILLDIDWIWSADMDVKQ